MVALPGEQVVEGGVNGFLDVVAGPDDTIYVVDAVQSIHVYSPDGAYAGLLGDANAPYYFADVAVAPDGSLWGVDFGGTVTHVSTEDGSTIASFSVTDQAGIAIGFNVQIGAGPDGNIYLLTPIAGATENEQVGQVVVLDASGQVLRQFEIGRAEFYYDATMTFGPDGNLYAVEIGGNQGVRVFDSQGNLLREGIGAAILFVSPGALAVGPDGSIYAGAAATGALYHFAPAARCWGASGNHSLVCSRRKHRRRITRHLSRACSSRSPGWRCSATGMSSWQTTTRPTRNWCASARLSYSTRPFSRAARGQLCCARCSVWDVLAFSL